MIHVVAFIVGCMAPVSVLVRVKKGASLSKSLGFSLAVLAFALSLVLFPPVPPFGEYLLMEIILIWSEMYIACDDSPRWALPVYLIYMVSVLFLVIPSLMEVGFNIWLIGTPVLISSAILLKTDVRKRALLAGVFTLTGILVISQAPQIDPLYENIGMVYLAVMAWWSIGTGIFTWHMKHTRAQPQVRIDFSTHKGFNFELRRKMMHISLVAMLGLIPFGSMVLNVLIGRILHFGYNYTPLEASEIFLRFGFQALAVAMLFIDTLRLAFEEKSVPFKQFANRMIREREVHRYLGATHLIIAIAFLSQFLDLYRIIALILVAAFGDASGALVGTKWGKARIMSRSIEGTVAEGVVTFLIVCLILGPLPAIGAAVAIIIGDWISDLVDISDNLLIPVFVAVPLVSL